MDDFDLDVARVRLRHAVGGKLVNGGTTQFNLNFTAFFILAFAA